jgi:hypothetical protein
MCTDFIDLNKCCPEDDFPLSRIDKVIDSAIGCEAMVVLDYFLGYHQIWLRREVEEKTSFIIPFSTYCYMWMPKGLKNSSSIFYRMTHATLRDQIGRNIFIYVNDIVVTSRKKCNRIKDLVETFANMHEAQLKLNPNKYVFGMHRGKVFDYLVFIKGIEANLYKIKAITHMKP